MSDCMCYVLRDSGGAYLQGYEDGACVVGKKRHAKVFQSEAEAHKAARTPHQSWIVEKLDK